MAKESGIGWTSLTVDNSAGAGKDIKNDVTNLQFSTPRAVIDVTGIDSAAIERILGLADFSITMNGEYNNAADLSHAVLSDVASTSVVRTVALTVSGKSLSVECLLTDYALTRAQGGELSWSTPGVLANGTAPTWT